MKTTTKFFAVIIACVFFTSCQSEDVQPESSTIRNESSLNGNGTIEKGDHMDKGKLESFQESRQ